MSLARKSFPHQQNKNQSAAGRDRLLPDQWTELHAPKFSCTLTLSDALGPNLSFVPAWKTCEDCSCSVTGRSSVCSVQSTTFHRSFLIINSRDAWKPGGGTKRRRERGDTKWTDYTTLARAPSHSHMHKLYTPPPLPHAFLPSLSVILTNCWSWLSNNNPQSLVLVAQSRKKK